MPTHSAKAARPRTAPTATCTTASPELAPAAKTSSVAWPSSATVRRNPTTARRSHRPRQRRSHLVAARGISRKPAADRITTLADTTPQTKSWPQRSPASVPAENTPRARAQVGLTPVQPRTCRGSTSPTTSAATTGRTPIRLPPIGHGSRARRRAATSMAQMRGWLERASFAAFRLGAAVRKTFRRR